MLIGPPVPERQHLQKKWTWKSMMIPWWCTTIGLGNYIAHKWYESIRQFLETEGGGGSRITCSLLWLLIKLKAFPISNILLYASNVTKFGKHAIISFSWADELQKKINSTRATRFPSRFNIDFDKLDIYLWSVYMRDKQALLWLW